MKKLLSAFLIITMLWGLCSCGKTQTDMSHSEISANNSGQGSKTQEATANDDAMQDVSMNTASGLTNLTSTNYAYCNTDDGYYYISEKSVELKDGSWGTHIMYMDFATGQEVYLCSDTGCSHDKKSCTAMLSEDEFTLHSCRIFAWNGNLYLLDKDYDNDGTTMIDLMGGQAVQAETRPAVLYKINPDGTNRQKVCTFADGLTLEDTILSTNENLYFVTKKLETNIDGNTTVTTSTERNIVQFTPSNNQFKTIASLDTDNDIFWNIIGCYDNSIVLEGISYANGDSGSADMSQTEWQEMYSKSKTVFAALDLNSKKLTDVYQMKNTGIHSSTTNDGVLYISDNSSQDILAIDLRNGNITTLASLPQNNIMGVFSAMLVCQTWDLTDDATLYFINTRNGEINHCTLTNQYNGWPLELICEAGNDALIIYDYKADAHSDGSYEIYQYKYALIAKEELYAGKNTFRPIEMIGRGR